MALDKIKTAMIEDAAVTAAKAAADVATQAELDVVSTTVTVAESDADKIQTNLAILAFKTAATGSLAKYSLKDQIVDEFVDATGVDASASTNETLTAGVYSSSSSFAPTGGDSTDTSVSGYTTRVFTTSRALTVTTAGNVSVLVVGGGGSGGNNYGGGGGAGGLVYDAVYAVTANTYDMVIGAGGAGQSTNNADGNVGIDTTLTINGGAVQFTAKGGGFGGGDDPPGGSVGNVGGPGGSGGGNSYVGGAPATTQAGTAQHGTVDVNIGYAGGTGVGAPDYNPAGGGGAGSVGANAVSANSGAGGTGYNASAIFGTAVGDSGYFASGGGGGYSTNGGAVAGTASSGGGTAGAATNGGNSTAAAANTGGGSGGGGSTQGDSGNGGSGVVLVRYSNNDFLTYTNLTLQSTDTAAETEADYADMVMLIEDAAGTATINTDIKGFISEDSGVTFTEGVLVDEGDWGTNKRILAFHDLDISAQSGTAMCYKITTHNQSASKITKIHATSIGWR